MDPGRIILQTLRPPCPCPVTTSAHPLRGNLQQFDPFKADDGDTICGAYTKRWGRCPHPAWPGLAASEGISRVGDGYLIRVAT